MYVMACSKAQRQQARHQAGACLGKGPHEIGRARQQVAHADIQPLAKELNKSSRQHRATKPSKRVSRSKTTSLQRAPVETILHEKECNRVHRRVVHEFIQPQRAS